YDGHGFDIGKAELNNPKYQAYLKSRVQLDPIINNLVVAYSEVENLVETLIEVNSKNSGGLGFDPRNLKVQFRQIEVDKKTSKVSLKIEENTFYY
ncbi:MAG: hypothetical protein ACYT04_89460, partial [Nostoc sp.]